MSTTGPEATCSARSALAGEPLAGTATRAERWLLVEVRGPWGRDALAETALPDTARVRLEEWAGEEGGRRVLLVRRGDRRDGPLAVFAARSGPGGGVVRRHELARLEDVARLDLERGGDEHGRLWLVCAHGRRDPCCARLGVPVHEALRRLLPEDAVWQSSHQGGHRFAANVLLLPEGVQLGRLRPDDAAGAVREADAGRIPLAAFRGRTFHPPEVQAADAAVRERHGLTGLDDVRWAGTAGGAHVLDTPLGRVRAVVEPRPGPLRPESCGAGEAPSTRYEVRLSEPSSTRGEADPE